MEHLLSEAYATNDLSVIRGSVLVDSRVGIPPLNHIFARSRVMAEKFTPHPLSRSACLFPSNTLVRTMGLFLRTMINVRLYSANERDEALSWLREPRTK